MIRREGRIPRCSVINDTPASAAEVSAIGVNEVPMGGADSGRVGRYSGAVSRLGKSERRRTLSVHRLRCPHDQRREAPYAN